MTEQWKKKSARFGWLAGAIAGAALTASLVSYDHDSAAQAAPVQVASAHGASSPGSFADVIESVSPAVVNIMVSKVEQAQPTGFGFEDRGQNPQRGQRGPQTPFDEFFGRFFDQPNGQRRERRTEGQGSGFIIDPSGYIVTNNHVADGADKIVVTMQDGRKFDATLVGHDVKTDLAVIKVNATDLPHVSFGDSDHARVGDWVVAIGNPFGLGGTATAGIVSARGRDIQSGPYDDYLQLDAPINFGNSGGPVFNANGEVIGVTTAIFSPNGGNIGIGFAIPANQAKTVTTELRNNGSVERGWLGVQIQNLDDELSASLKVPNNHGALVAEVLKDSPAARSGVKAGDVITRFNDREIDSARTLSRVVADTPPNKSAKVTVWREGKNRELTVKLGEAAKSEQVADTRGSDNGNGNQADAGLGLTLRPLTDEDRSQLSMPSNVDGALVAAVDPDSPAASKGLRPGDVITQVNQQTVKTPADAVAALNAAKKTDRALLLVRRGDSQRFVALRFS
jgi:serine protease Do